MIELAGIVVSGRPRPLVDGCSLRVGPGEIHALVGAPGAGKSTLIAVLMGRLRPTRGIAQVLGFDCAYDPREVQRRVTFVPEGGQVDSRMTPRQHLHWLLELSGRRPDGDAVRRAMRAAEIADRHFDVPMNAIPAECQVLIWLALADLRGHQVVVLDDPTRRHSFIGASRLTRLLRERQVAGASILVATRDARFGENVATTVTALEDGRTGSSLRLESARIGRP